MFYGTLEKFVKMWYNTHINVKEQIIMYRPLEYAKKITWEELADNWKEYVDVDEIINIKSEDMLHYLYSDNFMNPDYKGKFGKYTTFLYYAGRIMFPESKSVSKEWFEMFLMFSVVDIWKRNKQVVKCDDDFIDALAKTDGFKIPVDLLKRLPFTTFCIDMLENEYFKDHEYLYVDVRATGDKEISISTIRIVKDEIFFAASLKLSEGDIVEENGISYYRYNRTDLIDERESLPLNVNVREQYGDLSIDNSQFTDFYSFLLQLLTYMCAANRDFKENEITKKTYKKPATIKNKFSEIQKWDVGVVIGKTIRAQKEKIKRECIHREHIGDAEPKARKATRPHYRNAHWQHYHVGVGRQETIIKWKEPCFVNGTAEDVPVTIHAVR